jgi:hypothetical protein
MVVATKGEGLDNWGMQLGWIKLGGAPTFLEVSHRAEEKWGSPDRVRWKMQKSIFNYLS